MQPKNYAVKSTTTINASQREVWRKVGFYEHVKKQPGLLLRLSLPIPVAVEGRHSAVGDTCRCKYSDGGYLTKRITRIEHERRIEFEIIEQSIRYQATVRLLGGYIEVVAGSKDQTVVNMVTRYDNRIFPGLLSGFFIDRVIRAMHRFVMLDMRKQLEPGSAVTPATGAI